LPVSSALWSGCCTAWSTLASPPAGRPQNPAGKPPRKIVLRRRRRRCWRSPAASDRS
jgi:hypothetical protein